MTNCHLLRGLVIGVCAIIGAMLGSAMSRPDTEQMILETLTSMRGGR